VVTGLVTGRESPRHLRARERLAEEVNWRTVAFLLESGLFLLMGLQIKSLIDDAGSGTARAVWIGLLASLLVVVLRILFVAPLVANMSGNTHRAVEMQPMLEKMQDRVDAWGPEDERYSKRRKERFTKRITRKKADLGFYVNENIGWRGGAILAWSGMRGAITVAAAQSLPDDTPYRSQLLLIAFVVAVTTLLVQGLTLPRVIRTVKIPGDDGEADRAEYVELLIQMAGKVEALLDDPEETARYDPEVVEKVRGEMVFRGQRAQEQQPGDSDPREQFLALMLRVMAVERDELLAARADGTYSSRTLNRAQHSLDVVEAGLQQVPEPAN
jgi:CPA1 family monovalent cation:H+ antiporter